MYALEVINLSKAFDIKKADDSSLKNLIVRIFSNTKPATPSQPFWALRDISFSLRQGEVLGIIGPNGAGKSTLLKLIAGVMRPTSGRIHIQGKVISILELGLGFQPDLSGRDNILFNAQLHGFSRSEVFQLINPILDYAELVSFANQPLKNYSSGMQMRLAFSIASFLNGDILIFDEIFGVGDESFRSRSYTRIEELIKQKKTIILVSHNLNEISSLCDNAIILENGFIREYGKAIDIVEKYSESSYVDAINSKSHIETQRIKEPQPNSEISLTNNDSLIQAEDRIEDLFPPIKYWSGWNPYGDPIIKLHQFEILTNGQTVLNDYFNVAHALTFKLTFELTNKSDNLDFGIIIRKVGQNPAVIIHSGLDSELSSTWERGTHSIWVDFPGNLLNRGFWLVDIIIVKEFEKHHHYIKDVAGFKLVTKKKVSIYETIELPSLLRPVYSWNRSP